MATNPSLDLGALRTALQEAGQPWQPGHTSMTALTERERVIRLGVPLPEGADVEQLLLEGRAAHAVDSGAARAAGAPASFDLRNVNGANYTTPIRDQGGCGSCVAFGTVATMEHVTRFTRGNPSLPIDYSEAQLFYCWGKAAGATCSSGWGAGLGVWGGGGGGGHQRGRRPAKNNGITFEDYFPYTAGDQNCAVNADWP